MQQKSNASPSLSIQAVTSLLSMLMLLLARISSVQRKVIMSKRLHHPKPQHQSQLQLQMTTTKQHENYILMQIHSLFPNNIDHDMLYLLREHFSCMFSEANIVSQPFIHLLRYVRPSIHLWLLGYFIHYVLQPYLKSCRAADSPHP